jgi:hypothetical protein
MIRVLEFQGEDVVGHVEDGLILQVRLLSEPCLWCWEIRDGVDGPIVESSWADHWVAFASRAEAAAAGSRHLASGASASCRRPPQRVVAEPTRRAG